MELHEHCQTELGDIPFVLIGNKADLDKNIDASDLDAHRSAINKSCIHLQTSALTGDGVDQAFMQLSASIIASRE